MNSKLTQRLAIAGIATAAVVGVAITSPAMASNSKNHVSSASVKTVKKASVSTPAPSTTPSTPSTGATPLPWQSGANGGVGGPGDNDGDGPRGDHRHSRGHGPDGKFGAPVTKSVTVDVPADGKTYELVVTEVRPVNNLTLPIGVNLHAPESFTVAVTGTGSQSVSVTVPHAGDYTVDLVAVSSTQKATF
jgi:hypothetical protein